MKRSYLDQLLAKVDDVLDTANSGGVDARDPSNNMLLDAIGHQRHVIAALVRAVQELRDEIDARDAADADREHYAAMVREHRAMGEGLS